MTTPPTSSPSNKKHQREVLWQISLPLILGALILVGAGILVGSQFQVEAGIQRWSSVALIWLIFPALVFAVFLLISIIGMIYLVTKLLGILPPYAAIVLNAINQGKLKIEAGAEAAAEPVLRLSALLAGLRALFRRK